MTRRVAPAEFLAAMPSGILPLTARGLVFEAGDRRLVDVADLEIGAGGPTVIMGPNGAGKSLLLRLLHGLIPARTGTIAWNSGPPVAKRQAMVFQRPVLLRRSVAANVDYALKAHGVSRAARPARVEAALARADLADLARQPARTLSGGEQQRLAVARALAVNPAILFLDEPTASLDPSATAAIERLVLEASGFGTKIVMVTHDIGQARRLAADIVFLHKGCVAERADAASFFNEPASAPARAYLAGQLVL